MTAGSRGWADERAHEGAPRRTTSQVVSAALWLALVWLYWFSVSRDDLAALLGSDASARSLTAAALLGLAGRIGMQLVEAGFYVALWRALAKPIAFGPLFVAVVSLSLCDACANVLARWADGDAPAWLVPLVGVRVLPDVLAGQPGLRVALGGVGLLAIARVAGTALAQWRLGTSLRGALALTGSVWLAGRLASWWIADLLRGMSPIG